jgi:tetratricopeptide (TPR) repeat protein
VVLSDEERLTLITSSWEPLQAEELESYGEPLFAALLTLEEGKGKEALSALLPLAERSQEASYLWLEVARAQLVAGEFEASEASLRKFIARIGPEEGGTARLLAHRELCKLCHERDDHEGAIRELEAAAEALEDDPRPLLDLGNYLRVVERPREAIEVLEMCAAAFGDDTVEWPVTMELGLACAEAGEKERAIQALEQVVQLLVSRGHMDLPPQAAVALAKLHEDNGNLARAADLFGALARGEDAANHALYHREASRLLEALGLSEEAQRMRERAEGLASPT